MYLKSKTLFYQDNIILVNNVQSIENGIELCLSFIGNVVLLFPVLGVILFMILHDSD